MFRIVPLSIIRSFSLYTQQWYMSLTVHTSMVYRFADSYQQTCMTYTIALCTMNDIYHCFVYSDELLMILQRNCLKHVEFYSKNKFEKLVYLVGFIFRLDAISKKSFFFL